MKNYCLRIVSLLVVLFVAAFFVTILILAGFDLLRYLIGASVLGWLLIVAGIGIVIAGVLISAFGGACLLKAVLEAIDTGEW